MLRRYDYKCTVCNYTEENWADTSDCNFSTCKECGETSVRIISPIRTHFVGHGWPNKDDKWAKEHEKAARK